MKHIAALLIAALALTGCAAVDTAMSVYDTSKNVVGGYHGYKSVKSLTNSNPHFQGYNSVLVVADIVPREDAPNVPVAFSQNMGVFTSQVARVVRAPLQVCYTAQQCYGKTLVLNFKEDAYDRNLVQRITMGSNIRGKLYFTDSASGRVLEEKNAEMAENYGSLAAQTSVMIVGTMLKSFPAATEQDHERVGAEIEKIPAVAPQYEKILGKAS